jgi:hypothetical protein
MKKGKALNWDGKSRVSNDVYRERWNEIFGNKPRNDGKGTTICKAKDCNNALYGWTSTKDPEYCMDCV